MAVTNVTELQEGTRGRLTDETTEYTRRFHVYTDDKISAKFDAAAQIGVAQFGITIPKIGAALVFVDGAGTTRTDTTLGCKTIDLTPVGDDPSLILVVCIFRPPTEAGVINPEDPTLDQIEISVDTFETDEPIFLDLAGNLITNSAGDPFDPPLTEVFIDAVATITLNRANEPLTAAIDHVLEFNNKLNSDVFLGKPARRWWMRVTMAHARRNKIKYWRTTYSAMYRAEGWDQKNPDEGFRVFKNGDSGSALVEAVDENGRPINAPILLDGAGSPLAPGAPPVLLTFQTKAAVVMSPLIQGITGEFNI